MDVRRWALMLGISAGCAGCVTETTTAPLTPDIIAKTKNLKEVDGSQREARPQTWIALGEVREAKADDEALAPMQRSAIREEARKAYQKAIELDPLCVDAHLHLANLYVKQEDTERALGVHQRAVQLIPKSAVLWHEQGVVLCRRQDLNSALKSFAKAHELEPENRNYATQLGLCLARSGQPREAVLVLGRVNPKAEANYYVGRMMMHINQPDVGREYLRAAVAERPGFTAAHSLLAQLEGPRNSGPIVLGAGPTAGGIDQAGYNPPR